MKRFLGMLAALVATVLAVSSASAFTPNVVISQVYGGGGFGGATPSTYNASFIELHNNGNLPADISGWSVQINTANVGGPDWSRIDIPAATVIGPGKYFLIRVGPTGGTGAALPTPDLLTAAIASFNTAAGNVVLRNVSTILTSGACPNAAERVNVMDRVGYGPGANCAEATGTAATSRTTAAIRKLLGCQDTQDNSADFDVLTPAPRNSATAANLCSDHKAPVVSVITPNGGEQLGPGCAQKIAWTAQDDFAIDHIVIEFSDDNGANYVPVTTIPGNPGTFAWTVPNSATTRGRIRVTAYDTSNQFGFDINDAQFDIRFPRLRINNQARDEGNAGLPNYNFNVSIAAPACQDITVTYTTADSTATVANTDYVAETGTVTILAGNTSAPLSIDGVGDLKLEIDEYFKVVLSSPVNAVLQELFGVGTIRNDDVQPTITVNDIKIVEGDAGNSAHSFTISLDHTSAFPITVDVATADGSAMVANDDYFETHDTITIPPKTLSVTFPVTVVGDTKYEGPETILLNLSNAVGAAIGDAQGIGSISNDDVLPSISIDNVKVIEGNGGTIDAVFTVSLSNTSGDPVLVDFETADNTATLANDDYVQTGGTLTIPAKALSATITVEVNGDFKYEPDETFYVDLSNAVGGTITDNQGIGTISNDDLTPPALSIGDVKVVEGSGTILYGSVYTPGGPNTGTGGPSTLHEVDRTTGATTPIGLIGFNRVGAMAFHSGTNTIYATGVRPSDGVAVLITIDPTSGAGTEVGPTGMPGGTSGFGNVTDMAFRPSDNVLFAHTQGFCGTHTIWTVNTTSGLGTAVGPLLPFGCPGGSALEFSSANVLYYAGTINSGSGPYTLGSVNQTTGAQTPLVSLTYPLGGSSRAQAMKFDPSTGLLLAAVHTGFGAGDPTYLASIDVSTGAVTTIGPTVSDLDGIVVVPVPQLATFSISLDQPSGFPTTVHWATSDGSATLANNDYVQTSGDVTLSLKDTKATVTVIVNSDAKFEPDETFAVDLSSPINATILDAQGIGTISNDDATISQISISDASALEDGGPLAFSIFLDQASGFPITVHYEVGDGSATTANGDYVDVSGDVTFAPKETKKTVTVAITPDTKNEPDEDLTVTLSAATGPSSIADGSGTGTILNDDATISQISITDVSQAEDSGVQSFSVSLDVPSGFPITVHYEIDDGTATTANNDYVDASGDITFDPKDIKKTIQVTVNPDTKNEPDEGFTVVLSANTGPSTILHGTGAGTIVNDDFVLPALSIADLKVLEGNPTTLYGSADVGPAGASTLYTIDQTSGAPTAIGPIGFNRVGAMAYNTANNTIYASGERTVGAVPVLITIDPATGAGVEVGPTGLPGGARIGVTDLAFRPSDNQLFAHILDASVSCLHTLYTVDVTTGAFTTVGELGISCDGGNALAFGAGDVLYLAGSTTPAGPYTLYTLDQTTGAGTALRPLVYPGSLAVPPRPAAMKFDPTSGTLYASVVTGLAPTRGPTHLCTIDVPTGTVTDVGTTQAELDGIVFTGPTTTATFSISLDQSSGFPVTVHWATSDGSATVANGDYAAISGDVTLAPKATSTTVSVTVNGDIKNESDETFDVDLSTPTNATIADGHAVGTISNDDATISQISITDVSQAEDSGVQSFSVSLDEPSGFPITVHYEIDDGTATTANNDYVDASGDITFDPKDIKKTIQVTVNPDTKNEPDEGFTVVLSANTGPSTILDGTGAGTIVNDDGATISQISITDVSQAEDSGVQSFSVSLDVPSGFPITVHYEIDDGTATTANGDYVDGSGDLTFAAKETKKTITVTVNPDLKNEPDEAFTVVLSANTGPSNIADGSGTGAIVNDDLVLPSLSITDESGNEDAGPLTFSVSLSEPSGFTVTVDYTTNDGSAKLANDDYLPMSGTLTFAPKQTKATVTVPINPDAKYEPPSETFTVTLANAVHATILDGSGTGTIVNDDTQPALSIDDVSQFEGNAGTTAFVFTVTLSNPTAQTVMVDFSTSEGTATLADNDYVDIPSGTLTFLPKETSKTITVLVNGDLHIELDEDFFVDLQSPVNATLANGQGRGLILRDDDDQVSVVPPPGTCKSPAHSCLEIPVVLERASSSPLILAYSVTLQLTNLAPCAPQFVRGDFFAPGAPDIIVTPNGGGSFTIDQAAAPGAVCTNATSATLFKIYVAGTIPNGTGTIHITPPILLRDCSNSPVAISPGPDALIPIDSSTPSPITDLAATQVKLNNLPANGTTDITLSWATVIPAGHTVEVWRKGFGNYPEYDDPPTPGFAPPVPAYPPSGAGWALTSVAASGQNDRPATRDYYYYVAFVKNECDNHSVASNRTGGTLNYHLGDVSDGFTPGQGNNKINGADISVLASNYGISGAAVVPVNYLDIGPTSDNSVDGLPTTDNKIEFEDLVIFALNAIADPTLAVSGQGPVAASTNSLRLSVPDRPSPGQFFDVAIEASGAGNLQALSARLDFDPSVVEMTGVEAGDLLGLQAASSVVLSSEPGNVDIAMLGAGASLTGSGAVAVMHFRLKTDADPRITLGKVIARDSRNRPVEMEHQVATAAVPTRTFLASGYPNPFKSGITLRLALSQSGPVRLAIYDVAGRQVRTLLNGEEQAGERLVQWDGRDDQGRALTPGLYVVELRASAVVQKQRLVMVH